MGISSNPSITVGVDLVRVADVAASIAEFGDRYLRRVFTAREVASCAGDARTHARLAARFAAKEATMKVLRPTDDTAIPWRSIEVVRNDGGWTEIELHDDARRLADASGIGSLSVSLTHEADYAIAVVLGAPEKRISRSHIGTRNKNGNTKTIKARRAPWR